MANPRIDELRRRIEREPGSRLFSQLAEELRKEGDLTEAIRVARAGLAAHPNYPSARLTLGRALFDTGQFGPARIELESVLRGAPDNILAARLLAECLEGLGDPGAALLQYRAAQRLSPGDKQIEAQVRNLEQRMAAGGSARGSAFSAPPAPPQPRVAQGAPTPAGPPSPLRPAANASAPRAPIGAATPAAGSSSSPVDDFDDVFEPAPAWKRSAQVAPAAKEETILLLEDEAPTLPGGSFDKEPPAGPPSPPEAVEAPQTLAFEEPPLPVAAARATEGTEAGAAPGADTLAGAPAFFVPQPTDLHSPGPLTREPAEPGPASPADQDRTAGLGTSTAAFAAFGEPAPAPAEALPSKAAPSGSSVPEPPPPASPPAGGSSPSADAQAEPAGANLSTPTLAELYCDQGFFDKAVEVYEQILTREPHNERVRSRLIEVKALGRALPGAAAPDPREAEKDVLRRKIARLEQMLAVVRRG